MQVCQRTGIRCRAGELGSHFAWILTDIVSNLPLGVVISVAAHAVLVPAYVWGVDFEADTFHPAHRAVPIEIAEPPAPPSSEPVAFALLDSTGPAEVGPAVPPAVIHTAMGSGRAVAPAIEPTIEPTIAHEHGPPAIRLLAMRRPDLRIRPEFRNNLDAAPAGTLPRPEIEPTGALQPDGGGTYRSDEGVFTAKIAKDGSVDLKDSKNFRIRIANPTKIPKAIARWIERDDKTPQDPERVALNNTRSNDQDTRPDHGRSVPLVGGGFDVTDAVMRRFGVDPYASRKLKYLDSTRDERVAIGSKFRAEHLKRATEHVQHNLDSLWSRTGDPAARKQGLFELWDDCAETGEPDVVEAGRAARALVIGAIRARFPASTEHAFTAQEIAAMNGRRQSNSAFAPYD